MYKKDVLAFFKTGLKVREVLSLRSTGTVSLWGEIIPEKQALKLHQLTEGKLRYDPSLYKKNKTKVIHANT